MLGVNEWTRPVSTITSRSSPTTGNFSIAGPRFDQSSKWIDSKAYGARDWATSSSTITGLQSPVQDSSSAADLCPPQRDLFGKYAVTPWTHSTGTVIGREDSGTYAAADPRSTSAFDGAGKYQVTPFD